MDKVQVLVRSRSDFAGGVDELTLDRKSVV